MIMVNAWSQKPCQDYNFITFINAFIKYFKIVINSQFNFKQCHQGTNVGAQSMVPKDIRILDMVEHGPNKSAQHG